MAIVKQVDIQVDTKQAVKSLDDLGGSFEDVYGDIQPLNTVIGELEDRLYQMAAAGEQNTEEFELLSKQIGDYKKVIIDTDLVVDSMATTTAQKLGGALSGVTAGFELGAGAMGAMGVESELIEEQLLKVQSAMAISQGVQGIKEAIPFFKSLTAGIMKTALAQKALTIAQGIGAAAMRVLNAVMNANPVFLLITGVAALTTAIIAFSGETEDAAEMNEKFNKSLERQNKLLDKTINKVRETNEHRLKMLELEGASEEELHQQRLKILKVEELARKAQMKSLEDEIKGKSHNLKVALKFDQDENAQAIKEELDAAREKYEELQGMNQDYNRQVELEDKQHYNNLEQQRKDDIANYKQYLANRRAADEEAEDIRLQLLAEGEFADIERLRADSERQRQNLLEDTTKTQEEKNELLKLYDRLRQKQEEEIRAKYIQDEKSHQEEVANITAPSFEDEALVEVEAEIFTQEQLREVRDYYRELEREADRIATQEKIDNAQSHLDNSMQFLNSLQSLNDAVTENQLAKAEGNEAEQEKIRKKAFERNKKLQIAMAVVQGVQGVMAAFTAGSSMGPAGVVMGPLMAALAAVTAGVNIAKIKASSYQGGGGGGGGSVPSAPRVPSFNVVGNSTENQLATSLGEQNNEPTKAFVVSEEVTTAQSLERNKIDTASL